MNRLPFLEVFADKTGGNIKIQTSGYQKSGILPIIDQGRDSVAGFTDKADAVVAVELPAIVFGDHTRAIKYVDHPFALGADGTKVLSPRKDGDARFLFHYLRSIDIPSQGYSRHYKFLKEITVPFPTLEEQRRIAAILDKADALRTKRRQAITHLDTLTQSIFHSMFGDPVQNPKDLPRIPLTDVGRLLSGGTPSKQVPDNWEGDTPWFSPKDIKSSRLYDSIDHISATVPATTSLRLLPARTVVFVVRGMILAHSFPVAMLLREATINQDLKAILPSRPFVPDFLLACLQSQQRHAVSLVETAAHGTKRLTSEGLREIFVFDVSLEVQENFVSRIKAVERLKDSHRKHLAELDALFTSLQHRAFKGEL